MTRPIEDVEVDLFVEGIFQVYGYDFRHYARASLKRRVQALARRLGAKTVSELQGALLHRREAFAEALPLLTVTVSEMFRDPSFYAALRREVLPLLATFPTLKIWHAGCSTGEEVHSLAILLREAGLLARSVIYATDINPHALKAARDGIYPLASVQTFTANYQRAGGSESFADYYTTGYGGARFDPELRERVVFSEHNLATDDVFAECHLIVCRNVLIYFDRALQERAIDLFARSLRYKGVLCLGSKETVRMLDAGRCFEDLVRSERVFRKARIDGAAHAAL